MSITKLKWQWQSSNWQSSNYTQQLTNHQPQVGRVITGMLTDYQPQSNHHPETRSSGGSNRGNNGF